MPWRSLQVAVGALQLVEALARRKVANVGQLPLEQVLRYWRKGRSPKIRMASAAVLTWCTRCPFTNEWMQDAKQVRGSWRS